ncbi:AAWKG family protein [Streptomyces sp. NPDC006872]|uniref:AAWKG family protein n=1 Tax=Streptomyces sp. NPDC006872 TaxID=3155720 RepID=UPI0033D09FAE
MTFNILHDEYIRELTDTDDWWHRAVELLTGLSPLPKRTTLFEEWTGNHGIPLMLVELTKQKSVTYVDFDDLDWRSENLGANISKTDFVIPFYTRGGDDGEGSEVAYYKARITLLISSTSDPADGGVRTGVEVKSKYKERLGLTGDDLIWDNKNFVKYSYAGGLALKTALNYDDDEADNGTYGFYWDGIDVPADASVVLRTFDGVADSFDRLARFFKRSADETERWKQWIGTEDNNAWQGTAAGVFQDLIHKIARVYEGYAEDTVRHAGGSIQGQKIREARKALRDGMNDLYWAWDYWQRNYSNPLRWLMDRLLELADWVWDHNIMKINYTSSTTSDSDGNWTTTRDYYTEGGFSQNAQLDHGTQDFGRLDNLDTWKKIGDLAVQLWQAGVTEHLSVPAKDILTSVHNAWSPQTFDIGEIRTRTTGDTLKADWQEDQAKKDKAEAEAQAKKDKEEAEAAAAAAAAEAERIRKEQEAEAERIRKEQEAEAERIRKEQEAEAERIRKEQEEDQARRDAEAEARYQQEKEDQARRDAEAEARYQQEKADQEAAEAEAAAQYEREKAEQEAEQDRQEAIAEERYQQEQAKQDAAEAEAEARYQQEKADQEAQQAEQQAAQEAQRQEQAEQQAKQEAAQQAQQEEQKAQQAAQQAQQEEYQQQQMVIQQQQIRQQREDQERARKEAAAEQAEQEAKQEAAEAEQKAEQQQAEAEQKAEQQAAEEKYEREQAEQKAEQARQEAEQKAEQARLEAKQDAQQAEQEAAQEARYQEEKAEQVRQEAEQKAEQARLEAKQDAQQAEAAAKQEAQQAAADARYEQEKAEQKAEQARQEARQDAQEAEAQARYDQEQAEQKAEQARLEAKEDALRTEQQAREDEYRQQQLQAQEDYQSRYESSLNDPANSLVNGAVNGPVNGSGSLTNPDGSTSYVDNQGRVITDFSDGTKTIVDPDLQTSTVIRPDGQSTTGPLNADEVLNNPDGSRTYVDSQGQVVTNYPDGSKATVDPDSGVTTVTEPNGNSTTGYLNNGGSGYQYQDTTTQLPSYEEELYDNAAYGDSASDYLAGNTAAAAQQQQQSQMPMGGMPLNGMQSPRGGGGSGEGSGERVRNVIDSDGAISNRARSATRSSNGGFDEREATVATSGGTPFMPPMGGGGSGGPGQQQTESGDRVRDTWVQEDEDVWGTDEGGAPAVIGR